MPAPLRWTDESDRLIATLRAQAKSWDSIAAALRISRWTAIERARHLGVHTPSLAAARPRPDPLLDPAREPLPAGHPVSWGALVAGTLLHATPYPLPSPDDTLLQDRAA